MFVEVEFVVQGDTKESSRFRQFDGGVTHFNGSHCPFPVPGEHDNFGFDGAEIEFFGLAPGADGFKGSLCSFSDDVSVIAFS